MVSMLEPTASSSASTSSSSATAPSSSSTTTAAITHINGTETKVVLDTVESALEAIRNGEFVVVVDDMSRENEGDLIIAASKVTTEKMAWLIRHSSGYVCICLPSSRLQQLSIPMMYENNQEKFKTAYAVTVDYKGGGVTTGISAHDRALTARKLADFSGTMGDDFTRPGHLVPLRAMEGGVLKRRGHTEASIDLCQLASLAPAGVICELLKPDDPQGGMARRDDCFNFAKQWGLKMISIEQIEEYRKLRGV